MYVVGVIFGAFLAVLLGAGIVLFFTSLVPKAARGVPTAGNIARANVREQAKAKAAETED
jgi:hypothetical protein